MAEPLSQEFLQQIPMKDRALFSFYYAQTANEALPVMPEYTWDEFAQHGYAPFRETADYNLDKLDELAGALIPNYRVRSGEYPAMLDAFKGAPAEAIAAQTNLGKAAIINCSHPSLATPIIVSRSLIEAMGPDIRKRLYIVYGVLPTVFQYELLGKKLSPVGIARAVGNVMLTAAKSPSNETEDKTIEYAQHAQRAVFKRVFEEATAPRVDEEGSIVVVCVTGQRNKGGPVLRPDGSLGYLDGLDVWSVGVDDTLLGPEIVSHVWMQANPEPIHVEKSADVHASNSETCRLASHGNMVFPYESRFDHARRLMTKGTIEKLTHPQKPQLHLG